MGWETAVGLALAAAGTGVSVASARQSRNDMNRSIEQSLLQTKEYQKQAKPIAESALAEGGAEKTKRREVSAAESARAGYESTRIPGGQAPLPVDTTRASGYIDQQRDAAAESEGVKEAGFADWQKNTDANRRLGVISNLAGSVAGTAPVLASLAGNRSANLAAMGSLMSTAGSLAGIYGAVKANSPKTSYKPREVGLVN